VRINRSGSKRAWRRWGASGPPQGRAQRVALTTMIVADALSSYAGYRETGLTVTVDQMAISSAASGGDGRLARLEWLARDSVPTGQVRRTARCAVRARDHSIPERPEDRDAASRGHGHLHQRRGARFSRP